MAYIQKKSPLKQTSGIGSVAKYKRDQENMRSDFSSAGGYINASESISKQIKNQPVKTNSTSAINLPSVVGKSEERAERKAKRAEKSADRRELRSEIKKNRGEFTKAVPADSSFSSMMAATIQNIGGHLKSYASARDTAKQNIKDKNAVTIEPMKRKEVPSSAKIKDKERSVVSPKKETGFRPYAALDLDKEYKREKIPSIGEQLGLNNVAKTSVKEEPAKKMTKSQQQFQQLNPVGKEKQEARLDKKYYYEDGTPKYNVKANPKTGKEFVELNPSPASRAIKESLGGVSKSITEALAGPFSSEARSERESKRQANIQKNQQRQNEAKAQKELELKKIKQIQGLPMVGDGFSKGMSRKYKYKK